MAGLLASTVDGIWLGGALTLANVVLGLLFVVAIYRLLRGQAE